MCEPSLIRCDALPVPHTFSTRLGGVSLGPFSSLNFGNPGELPPGVARDPKSNIAENFARLLAAIGAQDRRIVQVHQVHGADVLVVRRGDTAASAAEAIDWGEVKADAIVTDDPGCVLAVRVADCCPVLLASDDGTVVAAVHAGWRGVIAGVAVAAARAMEVLGARRIIAAIGPCISADYFEVGPEVVAEFHRVFGARTPIVRPIERVPIGGNEMAPAKGKALVDLKVALAEQLRECGAGRVETMPHCTVRDAELFFSHRREQGVTGRMVAVVGPRG